VSSVGNIRCEASDQVDIHEENNNVSSVGNIVCWASDVIKLKFTLALSNRAVMPSIAK
jgi:hypothetical protein